MSKRIRSGQTRQVLNNILLTTWLVLITVGVSGQASSIDSPSDAYDFPVKGGTREWAALGTHDTILDSLTPTERHDLLAECLQKLDAKQKHAGIYGHFGQERTVLIMGRILLRKDNIVSQKTGEETNLQIFLRDATWLDAEGVNEILMQARQCITGL